jgi:hypothetical protein
VSDDEGTESPFAALTDLYWAAKAGSELRKEIDAWAENALAAARTVAERYGDPLPADVSDRELESAIEAAEPELAQMITPDSVAEAALLADDREERSPLASSGAFATRTMAELLERQGDRRGAARIRAALGEPGSPGAAETDAGAVIAVLERWLENARRLQP